MNWKYVKKAIFFGLVIGLSYSLLAAIWTLALPSIGSVLWNVTAFFLAWIIVDLLKGVNMRPE